MEIDPKTVNDLSRRMMARIIARRIAVDPDMIGRARAQLELVGDESLSGPLHEWRVALKGDAVSVRRFLTARGERADWLRKWSPFTFVSGIDALQDVPTRRLIWRASKRVAITKARREMEEPARVMAAAVCGHDFDRAATHLAGQGRFGPDDGSSEISMLEEATSLSRGR